MTILFLPQADPGGRPVSLTPAILPQMYVEVTPLS